MNRFQPLFIALLTLILAACGGEVPPSPTADAASAEKVDTLAQLIHSVRLQSRLHTAEMEVHKVVLFTDDSAWGGRLLRLRLPGYRKVAIPIDVTVKGSIDFSLFSALNLTRSDSLLIVTLPDPQLQVTASRIDHAAIRQFLSLGRDAFDDAEITALARQGQDSIVAHLPALGLVEATRHSAARTLVPIFAQMGFAESNIVVRFRKEFSAGELRGMMKGFS